jgi:hypothetical protein
MEILNIKQCYFIQYKPSNFFRPGELDVLIIQRDKEWFASNLGCLNTFWNEVLSLRESQDFSSIKVQPREKKQRTVNCLIEFTQEEMESANNAG